MAKLFFNYSAMNAGKSTLLLQASHNYGENGMRTYRMTAAIARRGGHGRISSRMGISSEAGVFENGEDLYRKLASLASIAKTAPLEGGGGDRRLPTIATRSESGRGEGSGDSGGSRQPNGEHPHFGASARAGPPGEIRIGGATGLVSIPPERAQKLAAVFVDEAQFLEPDQVWQLARVVDDLDVPVLCYGLRTDFRGELFPGSSTLLAIADEIREVRTICHCGRKATMVVRMDGAGNVLTEGEQVHIAEDEKYVSLCRRHWSEAAGQK